MSTIKPSQRRKWGAELKFLRGEQAYLLVRRSEIEKVPKKARAESTDATMDLLCRANLYADEKERIIYGFASEPAFFNGLETMKERAHCKDVEFTAIIVKPLLLLERMTILREAGFNFEFGSPEEVEFKPKDIGSIAESARVISLARESTVWVLENGQRYGMTMDLDEKTYTLGFLSKEDGLETLDGVQKEDPGARLASNKMRPLVEGLLNSKMGGIILNPASSKEEVIKTRKLKKIIVALDTEPRFKVFLSKVAEKIF